MRLAVFGSETEDGMRFVKSAIRVGYDTQVLISGSDYPDTYHSRRLHKITGSFTRADITECMSGCDAVVVLMNNDVDQSHLELIVEAIQHRAVSRLVICENAQMQSTYNEFNRLATSLAGVDVDWTIVKPMHHDMAEAVKQLDKASHKHPEVRRSLEGFIVDQVTDSRYLGATVMVTS